MLSCERNDKNAPLKRLVALSILSIVSSVVTTRIMRFVTFVFPAIEPFWVGVISSIVAMMMFIQFAKSIYQVGP